jgi:hypothetical protein
VTLKITQHIRGLRREIECQVSGPNVDRFIGGIHAALLSGPRRRAGHEP